MSSFNLFEKLLRPMLVRRLGKVEVDGKEVENPLVEEIREALDCLDDTYRNAMCLNVYKFMLGGERVKYPKSLVMERVQTKIVNLIIMNVRQ